MSPDQLGRKKPAGNRRDDDQNDDDYRTDLGLVLVGTRKKCRPTRRPALHR
jgi:hypothetical protein